MTVPDQAACDRLLVEAFPRLERNVSRIAAGFPAHLRDELESELLVRMVIVARQWNGDRSLEGYVGYRLRFEALEWWRCVTRRPMVWPLLDDEEVRGDCSDEPYRQAVVGEILAHVADLPPRWQVALVYEEPVALVKLGVSTGRLAHLRKKGRAELRRRGVYELLEEAA